MCLHAPASTLSKVGKYHTSRVCINLCANLCVNLCVAFAPFLVSPFWLSLFDDMFIPGVGTLALDWNTLEKCLSHEQIGKFVRWATGQPTVKKSDALMQLQRAR